VKAGTSREKRSVDSVGINRRTPRLPSLPLSGASELRPPGTWTTDSGHCALARRPTIANADGVDDIACTTLSRNECLALLATTEFGHLTLTRRALPTVVPAHYVLDRDRVVIHAATGGDPDLWRDGEIVALHVDAFDTDRRAGWSVSVTGAVEQAANRVGARNISRAPWLPDRAGNVIAVSTDLVRGQRFGTADDAFGNH